MIDSPAILSVMLALEQVIIFIFYVHSAIFVMSIGLTCVYMTAAVLIPGERYVCPSDNVSFTCVLDQQSSKLTWRITFMHQLITSIE